MKICSPTFMLLLKLPIQYYGTHYVFMHVVYHHLYLLRAPTAPPHQGLSFLFPIPQACPDILKSFVFLTDSHLSQVQE